MGKCSVREGVLSTVREKFITLKRSPFLLGTIQNDGVPNAHTQNTCNNSQTFRKIKVTLKKIHGAKGTTRHVPVAVAQGAVHPESCKQDGNGETTAHGQNPARPFSEVGVTPNPAQSPAPALLQPAALPFSVIPTPPCFYLSIQPPSTPGPNSLHGPPTHIL